MYHWWLPLLHGTLKLPVKLYAQLANFLELPA